MSPPTPAEQVAALSDLAGWTPEPSMRRNLAFVYLIARSQANGATWAQIAGAIGAPNGKAAKAMAKRLAKGCQSQMLAALVDRPDVGE